MKLSRWLVAMLLTVSSNAALAQEAPTQAAQAVPAQLAPPPPTSVAPAPVPYAAPYVPRPAAPPGTVAVPPYPGPSPAVFASAAEFADYGTWRLEQLTARERGLRVLGRPQGYLGKRIGGFAMVVGGAGLAVVSTFAVFLATAVPHSGYDEEDDGSRRLLRGFGSAAVVGIALTIGGAIWLRQLKKDNPYLDEITDLRQERHRLAGEVQRARRQAKSELRTSFNLTQLQVRF